MGIEAASDVAGEVAFESKFQWFTRLGFAARGLLYVLIAYLLFRTGRSEDLTGALEYVGQGGGKLLLIALAAGLATYGLWRLSDAVFGTEHGGRSLKAAGSRMLAAGIGGIYLYLTYKAVRILISGHAPSSGAEQQASTVLHLPGGDLVLAFVALGFAIAGCAQFWKAYGCRFLRHLREGAGQRAWVKWMGRLGYAARGVIFLVVSWLLYRAAADRMASEAGNLEKALDVLRGSFRTPVAAGLLLFGLFSLVEARFRDIHKPPTGALKRKVGA
ncbi:MAG TPA: DUF1206 domain-containing protein [Sphingomicrobium sp.]|nr:DUF1206 domain-containing protein [Sphingomicrobium sp.]